MKLKLSLVITFLFVTQLTKATIWTVNNSGLTFSPNLITITFGDTVFFNIANTHDAREVSMATWTANGNTALAGGFQTPFGGGFVYPSQLAVGTHYYVCTPHAASNMKGRIVVNPCNIPNTPGAISGAATICEGSNNIYSVAAVSGATSYTWSLPSGWSGSSVTNSISITAGANAGTISVTADNGCGSSAAQTLAVSVDPLPATPGVITGNTNICSGTNNIYSITPVANAVSYTWTLPAAWTGSSNSDTISANAGGSGLVQVTADNNCGSSAAQSLNVTVATTPAIPTGLTGDSTVCQGGNGSYSITAVPGATSYTWSLPSGWSGSSATTSITVLATSGAGAITVYATNQCGNSGVASMNVSTDSTPPMPSPLTGNTQVCPGDTLSYSIPPVQGVNGYIWYLPSDWTLLGSGPSVNAVIGFSSGTIAVATENACGQSDTSSLNVTVNTVDVSVVQNGTTLTANATGSQYQWIDCSNNAAINGAIGASYTPVVSGDYAVIITSNGCVDTSSCFNVVVIGINEFNNSDINIYPVPSNGIIYIDGLDNLSVRSVEIHNAEGKTVIQAGNTSRIDLSGFAAGLYSLVIHSENGVLIRRVVLR